MKKIIPIWLKKKIKTFFLKGNNVKCNTCSKEFISFLPSGIPLRANAICPNCESLERTRIYYNYLDSIPDFFNKQLKVLHVAPEKILYSIFKNNNNFSYYPIDKFEPGYQYPKGTANMDLCNLEYKADFFNFILCSHVLEHINDDEMALNELFRVLSPGGFGIIQVPIDESKQKTECDLTIKDPNLRLELYGQEDHVRLYGLDFKNKLESIGFNVELNNFSKKTSAEDRFKFGFGSGETLYIVRKNFK